MTNTVLIVGHHPATVARRAEALASAGYGTRTTNDIAEAIALARSGECEAVVFLESGFDHADRERLVDEVRAARPELPVVESYFDSASMLAELGEVLAKARVRAR